jgi:hypothetical protein
MAMVEDLERDLLRFAAAHRVVSSDQAAVLARSEDPDDSAASASRLVGKGLLSRVRLTKSGPESLVITDAGLVAIESPLAIPAWEMRGLRQARSTSSRSTSWPEHASTSSTCRRPWKRCGSTAGCEHVKAPGASSSRGIAPASSSNDDDATTGQLSRLRCV